MDSQTDKGLKLAIYARVSGEEQRQGQTIDSQISELERFAKERNWQVIAAYKDDGFSGAVMARPALDKLRDDALSRGFQAVLINDVDRLARDVTHLGVLKRDFEKRGLRVIFRKLPQENSPANNLLVNILGSFAEFERELILDRTRRGRKHKIEVRKQFLGGLASYGYRYVPKTVSEDGRLFVVPEEAAVIRQIFAWVDQEGLSARKVMFRLNQQKMPPPKGGASWASSSVLRILHNEMYCGRWYYNKHESYESLEPDSPYRRHKNNKLRLRKRSEWIGVDLPPALEIISRDIFERVQEQLKRNTVFSPRHSQHFYLLGGLAKCGACHAAYVGDPCHGRFYYRCSKRCKGRPSVIETELDSAVWTAVKQALSNPALILEQAEKCLDTQRRLAVTTEFETREQSKIKKQLDLEESRLLEAYRKGIIGPTLLGKELEKVQSRRQSLKPVPEASDPGLGNRTKFAITDYCQRVSARLASMSVEEQRRLLRQLLDSVAFEGTFVRIRGHFPIAPDRNIQSPNTAAPSDSGIATTEADTYARNPAANPLDFELTAQVVKEQNPQPKGPDGKFVSRIGQKS